MKGMVKGLMDTKKVRKGLRETVKELVDRGRNGERIGR